MELWDSLIRMVSSLAVVLGLLLLATYGLRRWFPGQVLVGGMSPLVRILGSGYLGPKKQILVVAVAGEVLILGAAGNELIPLGRVKNQEQLRRLLTEPKRTLVEDRVTSAVVTFSRPLWWDRIFGAKRKLEVTP